MHLLVFGADPAPAAAISFIFSWVTLIQFVVQIILPLLVALVTTKVTSGRTRGIILAGITVLVTVLNAVVSGLLGTPVDLFGILLTALVGFVISVGFHFGLWGASGPTQGDGTAAPSISAKIIANAGNTSH